MRTCDCSCSSQALGRSSSAGTRTRTQSPTQNLHSQWPVPPCCIEQQDIWPAMPDLTVSQSASCNGTLSACAAWWPSCNEQTYCSSFRARQRLIQRGVSPPGQLARVCVGALLPVVLVHALAHFNLNTPTTHMPRLAVLHCKHCTISTHDDSYTTVTVLTLSLA